MSGNTPRQPDRRVRKTHEALHAALAGLIVSQGYDRISVQQVLDAADVGRSTFYAHFSGKEALLRSGFERLRHDLATKATTEEGPFAFVLPLLNHASHMPAFMRPCSTAAAAISPRPKCGPSSARWWSATWRPMTLPTGA